MKENWKSQTLGGKIIICHSASLSLSLSLCAVPIEADLKLTQTLQAIPNLLSDCTMPPRKKPSSSSSSKKSTLQSHPSKFGIQHFFERHTQNSQKLPNQNPPTSKVDPTSVSKPSPNPKSSNVSIPSCPKTDLTSAGVRNAGEEVENNGKVAKFVGSTSRNRISRVKDLQGCRVTRSNQSKQKNDVNSAAVVMVDEVLEENSNVRNLAGSTSRAAGIAKDMEAGAVRGCEDQNDGSCLQAAVFDNPSEITPSEDMTGVGVFRDGVLAQVSPEITKTVPRKRFKFSPGMVDIIVLSA